MGDEVQAAAAVVEAKVAAEGAQAEASAATVAAIAAEGAAREAIAAAETVEQMAEREVANATLDAEQRILKFQEELGSCRAEIASLQSSLLAMTNSHQSIQATLTQLDWLREIEATMTEEQRAAAAAALLSATSSGTGGDTSGSGGGETKPPEKKSDGAESPDAKQPDNAAHEAPEGKPKEPAPAAGKRKHRWL